MRHIILSAAAVAALFAAAPAQAQSVNTNVPVTVSLIQPGSIEVGDALNFGNLAINLAGSVSETEITIEPDGDANDNDQQGCLAFADSNFSAGSVEITLLPGVNGTLTAVTTTPLERAGGSGTELSLQPLVQSNAVNGTVRVGGILSFNGTGCNAILVGDYTGVITVTMTFSQ